MILPLVPKDNNLLTNKLDTFDFSNPPTDPIQLAKDLSETMLHHNGMGLAANQVGLPYRVFVIKSNPILACFNPKIVAVTGEHVELEEGCLTFPNYYVKIRRPKQIRVRYTYPNGETVTEIYDGMTARIFQHELDHLDGVLFMSRATLYHREKAEKSAKRANSGKVSAIV
jgi:peptide deformylase